MTIGPSFSDELATAGLLGLPFSWGPDGVFGAENLTPEQQSALSAVVAAHNPSTPLDLSMLDGATLNAALVQPGSVSRAMGEILFGVIKGTIPVTPSLTKAQFVAMLKAKMRNGA